VPIDPAGQSVKIYVCGPTVYDSAHLGHARAYLTFDIILRILTDYFGYDIFYVMNITDVDDKIILRARQNYLFDLYQKGAKDLNKVCKDVQDSIKTVKDKHNKKIKTLEEDLKQTTKSKDRDELKEMVENEKVKLGNVEKAEKEATEYIEKQGKSGAKDTDVIVGLLNIVKSEVSYLLDKKEGHTVTDHSIFRDHAARYEQEFLDDLKSLGIRMPSVLTRVSEYIEEIVEFVQTLIKKGMAYESNGSVYFNVAQFSTCHQYCKLRPECAMNTKLGEEGEGALGSSGEKKSQSDFALWKKSKKGEPQWDSPWGYGRPGWHIECSAMSGELLGNNFDIHGGGSDLKFPHHDNEIAQSEAFFDTHQWVNYWMHAGHLHVKGRKMSKSLKNFTTIRAALQSNSPRQLRLMFLLAKWDSEINFDENSLLEILSKEKQIKSFFSDAQATLRNKPLPSKMLQKWNDSDKKLNEAYLTIKADVHKALCDNLNWADAMKRISDLISEGNKYMRKEDFKPLLLKNILSYTTKMLRVFGVIFNDQVGLEGEAGSSSSSEEAVKGILDMFVDFRNAMRTEVKNMKGSNGGSGKNIMDLCDKIRDETLPIMGVRLTDTKDGSKWALEDPKTLMKEVEELKKQKKLQKEKKAAKLRKKIDGYKAEIKLYQESGKTEPREYFKQLHEDREKFTQFDANGMPTHQKNQDGTEEELKKATGKKLSKALKVYKKNFDKCKKKIDKDPSYFTTTLQEVIKKAEEELARLS